LVSAGGGGRGPRAWPAAAHLILFALIIALPLLLLLGILLFRSAALEREQLEQRIVQALGALVANVDRDIDRQMTILTTLAASPTLTSEDWPAFYEQAKASLRGKAYLVLVDSSGRQIVNTYAPYGQAPSMTGDPETLQIIRQTKTPVVSGLFTSLVVKGPVYNISVPIVRDEELRFVLSLGLVRSNLDELIAGQNLQKHLAVLIWDAKGVVLAASHQRMGLVGTSVSPQLRSHAAFTVFRTTAGDGSEELAAVGGLAAADWGVAVAYPASLVERQVMNSLLLWGATILLAGGLVVALGFLFGRQLTGALAAATVAARALGRGKPFEIRDSRLSEANAVNAALRRAARDLEKSTTALRESEEQLRAAAEGAQFGAHQYDVAEDRAVRSPQFRQILGVDESGAESTFESGLAFVHREDRDRTRLRKQQIIVGTEERYELEYRIRRSDGQVRWVMDRGQVVRDPVHGQAIKVVGVLLDITDRKAAEQRQRLLFDELNHRVKNTLSIVQSLAQQTLRTRPSPQDFARAFEDRLQSLARAHDLLTRESWQGASLTEIVTAALAPFLDDDRSIDIAGDTVTIVASTTITLSLMLHELATNAAKYGALSVPNGKLSVRWAVAEHEPSPIVDLQWREEDGPPVLPPERKGFGSRLLAASALQLGAQFDMDYAPTGLRCRLRFTVVQSTATA
jgi:PAS domain S-box-containing protein